MLRLQCGCLLHLSDVDTTLKLNQNSSRFSPSSRMCYSKRSCYSVSASKTESRKRERKKNRYLCSITVLCFTFVNSVLSYEYERLRCSKCYRNLSNVPGLLWHFLRIVVAQCCIALAKPRSYLQSPRNA